MMLALRALQVLGEDLYVASNLVEVLALKADEGRLNVRSQSVRVNILDSLTLLHLFLVITDHASVALEEGWCELCLDPRDDHLCRGGCHGCRIVEHT